MLRIYNAANIALKGNFDTKAFAPTSTIVNSRGIITVAANLNIQRGPSMSKPTQGRGDGTHWILREGQSKQQTSLYSGMIHDRRKIPVIIHEFWKFN